MRQLKFRAWDGEKMIYPDYISRDGLAYWRENSVIETSDKVMQFAGLKDKNGTEIYEGDKTKTGYVIMWSSKHALFCEHYFQNYYQTWAEASYPIDAERIEVIGNIYQS